MPLSYYFFPSSSSCSHSQGIQVPGPVKSSSEDLEELDSSPRAAPKKTKTKTKTVVSSKSFNLPFNLYLLNEGIGKVDSFFSYPSLHPSFGNSSISSGSVSVCFVYLFVLFYRFHI